MKIVIDIDENLFTRLFDCGKHDAVDMLNVCSAVRKGTPLSENTTNGDVIKALFPNAIYTHVNKLSGMNFMRVKGLEAFGVNQDFYDEWWNAPYKGGENE